MRIEAEGQGTVRGRATEASSATVTREEAIHGDLAARVSADTNHMDWAPSPSGTVWRKRLHRVGPPESGEVTSVVRYEPRSSFPAHDHPDGEEILVLEGIFSDEHGDWPEGTYLLNPEGFRHRPFSREGCVLFVKLRQFSGENRDHVALDTNALPWIDEGDGVERRRLYAQRGFPDVTDLERWAPHTDLGVVSYPDGVEIFVLKGQFQDELGSWHSGCWLRFPVGAEHEPRTAAGCTLYIKRGGLAHLRNTGQPR